MLLKERSELSFVFICLCFGFLLSGCGLFVPKNQNVKLKTDNKEVRVIIPTIDAEKSYKTGKPFKVSKVAGSFQVIATAADHKSTFHVVHTNLPDNFGIASSFVDIPLGFFTAGLSTLYSVSMVPTKKYSRTVKIPDPEPLLMHDSSLNYLSFDDLSIRDFGKEPVMRHLSVKLKRKKGTSLDDLKQKAAKDESRWDINYKETRIQEYRFIQSSYNELRDSVYSILLKSNFVDTNNRRVIPTQSHLSLSLFINQIDLIEFVGSSIKQAKVDMTWYLNNRYGELLDSFNLIDYSGYMNDDFFSLSEKKTYPINLLVSDAIQNGYARLKYDQNFLQHIKQYDRSQIGEVLTIKQNFKKVTNFTEAKKATVIVKTSVGHGSGLVVSAEGYILTNYHVIAYGDDKMKRSVTVRLDDGKELVAEVVKFNLDHDLALLRVNHNFDVGFRLAKPTNVSYFNKVFAFGAPRSVELQNSLTSGVFSSERLIDGRALLQLGMAVNSGNSGGPLFDESFELKGIVVSKLVGRATEGVAFAIPAVKIGEYLKIDFR